MSHDANRLSPSLDNTADLYETDFQLWAKAQAKALRAVRQGASSDLLDTEHLAEEIESLGKRDRRELVSRLTVLLTHWLKLECSRAENPRQGWRQTVREQRREIVRIIADSPSLQPYLTECLPSCWESARRDLNDTVDIRVADLSEATMPAIPALLDADLWPSNRFGLDRLG